MSCQRHHLSPLKLLLLLLTAHIFSATSAFSAGWNERPLRRAPSVFASAPVDDRDNSQPARIEHPTCGCKTTNDFRLGESPPRWSMPLLSLIASVMIALPPPWAVAVQHAHPTTGRGDAWPSTFVLAGDDFSAVSPGSIADLGLKPPTEEKPQIMLNGGSPDGQPSQQTLPGRTNARKPILQGLVYFPERASEDPAAKRSAGPQTRQRLDYYSDVLVLTAVAATRPEGPVLAGAKFPVSSVRFPFSFQMYTENLLLSRPGVRDIWAREADAGDIILRANICPSNAPTFPCNETETKKYAEGVAKLITNLPGMKEGETIRAPASLALQ